MPPLRLFLASVTAAALGSGSVPPAGTSAETLAAPSVGSDFPLAGTAPARSGPFAPPPDSVPAREAAEAADGWWRGLLGSREPDRVYGGLWTLHLKRTEDGLSSHGLLGLGWRGFYGSTFVNSHGGRSWALGLSRWVVALEGPEAGFSLGYRTGILGGYDEQLTDLAERWPAIPAAEIVGTAWYGRLGLQLSWAGIVTSVGGFVNLGAR